MKVFSSNQTKQKDDPKSWFDESNALYQKSPEEEISLEDFKTLAIKRIQILRKIEMIFDTSNLDEEKDDNETKLKEALNIANKEGMGIGGIEREEERNHRITKDNQAHFITKLAYCKDPNKRKWFLTQEKRLFRAKMHAHQKDLDILRKFNYQFNTISEEEWANLKENIKAGTYRKCFQEKGSDKQEKEENFNRKRENKAYYYKISYKDAVLFIGNQQVYLHKGFAYLFHTDLNKLLVDLFSKNLEGSLENLSKHIDQIEQEDERIKPLINFLSETYLGKDYSKVKTISKRGKINIAEIDILANRNFPACMKNLYDNLKKDHHLRHNGRLQFGLFLKGIGLTLEESLLFWRNEFIKGMATDVFEKKYAYNIKHNYGKEGKGVNYTPKSCMGILSDPMPGQNEHHGCPFKTMSDANLTLLLKRMGIDTANGGFQVLLQKKRENHYQVACKKAFEILNPDFNYENVGQHPNGYFESSLQNSQKMKIDNLKALRK